MDSGNDDAAPTVRQLRLVVEAEDYEAAVAFEVDDARAATQRLVSAGATQVAPPTLTPWQSLNARLDAPAALHITVFEELRDPAERGSLD